MSKQETGFVLVNRISLFSHSPLQANENYKFLSIEKYESQTIISLNPDDDNADILFYKNLEDLIENDISKSGENSVPLFDTVDDLLKVYDKNTISCIYKVYASGQLINMPTDYNVFKSFRILKQV